MNQITADSNRLWNIVIWSHVKLPAQYLAHGDISMEFLIPWKLVPLWLAEDQSIHYVMLH